MGFLVLLGQYRHSISRSTVKHVSALACVAAFLLSPLTAHAVQHIATIPVGAYPEGVAVNPSSNRVYVVNRYAGTVSVVDGSTHAVLTTIAVGDNPMGVAIHPGRNRVYVGNNGSISVIDAATNQVVQTIAGVTAARPTYVTTWGVGVNPTTDRIYVACTQANTVSVIDAATNTVINSIPVGAVPEGLALNSKTNRIYVTNYQGSSVSVIDGGSNSVVATVGVGAYPRAVSVNEATDRIYVVGDGTTKVIDGATNTVVETINLINQPSWIPYLAGVGVNPSTGRVYVSKNLAVSELVVVNSGTSHSVIQNLTAGTSLAHIAVDATRHRIYVTNQGGGNDLLLVFGDPPPPPPPDPAPKGSRCPSWQGKNLFLCVAKTGPPPLPYCPPGPLTYPGCPPRTGILDLLDPFPPLCGFVTCPECLRGLSCPHPGERYELLFDSRESDLTVALIDRNGKEIARMKPLKSPLKLEGKAYTQSLRFQAEKGMNYYLQVSPGEKTATDVGHSLKLHLRKVQSP